ncbi:uncharacterized protein VP01_3885g2, partial [Puccinia sorghi]
RQLCLGPILPPRMNVLQEEGSVTLNLQRHYIKTQLERFDCQNLHAASTPMKPQGHVIKATKAERLELIELGNNYRSLVGAMNYLSITTFPDINFAVSSLLQYLNEPGDVGLKLKRTSPEEVKLIGYADANWASCPEARRSV